MASVAKFWWIGAVISLASAVVGAVCMRIFVFLANFDAEEIGAIGVLTGIFSLFFSFFCIFTIFLSGVLTFILVFIRFSLNFHRFGQVKRFPRGFFLGGKRNKF